MPQTHRNTENKHNYGITDKPRFKNAREKGKYFYPSRYQYYNSKYGYQPQWNYFQWRRATHRNRSKKSQEKEPPRPPSPFTGTEEYNLKKIQEASDMIKKQLLMPPEASNDNDNNSEKNKPTVEVNTNSEVTDKKSEKCESEKTVKNSEKTANNNKKVMQYDVGEIHKKIITHISNLNYGKKMNLICATSSGYDVAIQQIQRQKRLELSKALRDMCSNQTVENSQVFNSIMPDIGIKIEDLPLEVIQELSSTLDLNFEESLSLQNDSEQTVTVKTEICESDEYVPNSSSSSSVKAETFICDVTDNIIECPMDTTDGAELSEIKVETTDTCLLPMHNSTEYEEMMLQVDSASAETAQNADFYCNNSEDVKLTIPLPEIKIDQSTNCVSTQTDLNFTTELQVNNEVENLEEAIKSMLDIDKEIARLTELRQSIFFKLQSKTIEDKLKKKKKRTEKLKKKKQTNKTKEPQQKKLIKSPKKEKETTKANLNSVTDNQPKETTRTVEPTENLYKSKLNFEVNSEKILVMQVFRDTLVAGSESGKIYYIDLNTGNTLHMFRSGESAVTAFCLWHTVKKNLPHLFVSSFDTKIQEYDFRSTNQIRTISTEAAVQCMELNWGFIFIGTVNGHLLRYSLKTMKIEFEENISWDRILVLKATQEGARRVLLVGTKNYPVCVRDAMSGLHMRTMNDIVTPTVYSLLLEDNLVYCATTLHDILVYSFHEGTLVRKYQASNSKGVGLMKIVDNLLFASCYDGNIYVYNTKTRQYVGLIEGPGGVIMSMEVLKNLVIVGTMSVNFSSILIPEYILECRKHAFQ